MTSDLSLPRVVMLRHAQSEWNLAGRFTGWADPALTEAGRAEAVRAGRVLARHGFHFDQAFSSRLTRARDTAGIVLREMGQTGMPLVEDWRLNERHYGGLQGADRLTIAERVGEAQVRRWRRGYHDRPPTLAADDPAHPARDPRWKDIPRERLPNGESLAQTRERVAEFWNEQVRPQLQAGRHPLIASHGNTLRALLMALQGMSVDEVEAFEVPTGAPIVFTFSARLELIGWHYLQESDPSRRAA